MKIKNGFYIINVPIFFSKIHVKLSDDFIKDAHTIGIDLIAGANGYAAICFKKKKDGYVILFSKKCNVSHIAHECLHAANYILKDCGVEVTVENDEAQAYLLSYIVKKVTKVIPCK